jgi:DNA replication protein DnaC
MNEAPKLLLAHHLKTLKLPTVLREYDKVAQQCAAEGLDHVQFLARLVELELIDRERRMIERRIKAAKFPAVKSLDSFDFKAIPSLNKMQVLELARCEWIERRENVIALGPSGTGKTHVALGLGLAACQKGLSVGFITAAALVHELMEARDERRLLRLQKQMAGHKLLIIDELGFVPLSKTGAELLFELISQRYERGSILITSNLPFDEWTETFGSVKLPRFCGHPTFWGEGVHDVEDEAKHEAAVRGGVPPADGGAGAGWPNAGGTRPRVRADGAVDPQLGRAGRS